MGLIQEHPSALVAPSEPRKTATLHDEHKVHTLRTTADDDAEDSTAATATEEPLMSSGDPIDDEMPLLGKASSTLKDKFLDAGSQSSSESTSESKNLIPVHGPPRAKRLRALGYVVFAAFNFSIMSACVKFACRSLSSHEVALWRTILAWAFNYAVVRYKQVDLRVEPALRSLLLLRCFIGTVCISLIFYAVSQMVLTDAIVIIFTSPVITFILGALLLGEAIDRIDFACALLSYIGVFFVARPAFLFGHDTSAKGTAATSSLAITCAFGAAFAQACAYIATRKLHALHSMSILHYFSLFGIVFSLAMVLLFDVTLVYPTQLDVLLALVASAAVSCVGSVFLTLGFQQENAGIASVMRYFDVLFVFIWDTTLLGEQVSSYSVVGALVIVAGAVSIGVRRARAKK